MISTITFPPTVWTYSLSNQLDATDDTWDKVYVAMSEQELNQIKIQYPLWDSGRIREEIGFHEWTLIKDNIYYRDDIITSVYLFGPTEEFHVYEFMQPVDNVVTCFESYVIPVEESDPSDLNAFLEEYISLHIQWTKNPPAWAGRGVNA